MGLRDIRGEHFGDWQIGMSNMDFTMCADAMFYLLNTIEHDTPLYDNLNNIVTGSRKAYDEKATEYDILMRKTTSLSLKQDYENQILSLEVSFWKELYTVFFQRFLKDDLISKT